MHIASLVSTVSTVVPLAAALTFLFAVPFCKSRATFGACLYMSAVFLTLSFCNMGIIHAPAL